jgi:hypothetical protein
MQSTIEHLEKIIRVYLRRLESMPDEAFEWRPRPEKWSRKEILGHLVDSAQNNIRRFIVARYEETPNIVYKQDEWVRYADYQHYPVRDLIQLWNLLNRHLVIILKQVSPGDALRMCAMGSSPQTLKWVAADYCNHLLHHLHQILDIEPLAYP